MEAILLLSEDDCSLLCRMLSEEVLLLYEEQPVACEKYTALTRVATYSYMNNLCHRNWGEKKS